MRFYNLTNEYVSFLKNWDSKVPDNKNEKRPYVGTVLELSGVKYFAPITSPKEKHRHMKNSKDFRKINEGKYGAINLNNMIPVVASALIDIDIPNLQDKKYMRLLQDQYSYIRADQEQIRTAALRLHTLVFTDDQKLSTFDLRVKNRCCNLPVLENAALKYKS